MGNLLAVQHGANSREIVAARTAAVRAEYLERFPFLAEKDEIKLDIFFSDKARYDLLSEHVFAVAYGEKEAFPRKGMPRTGVEAVPQAQWDQLTKLSAVLGRHANDLGLDPTGFAKFAKDASYAAAVRGERVRGLSSAGLDVLRARGEIIDAEEVE